MALTVDYRPVMDAADLMRRADKNIQKDMRRAIIREVNPWIKSAVRRNATDAQSRKIAGTARIRSGNKPAVVVGGAKKFSGGETATGLVRVYEFGGFQNYRGTYRRRSPRGRQHTVTRRTQRQIPRTQRSGRFVYPAVAEAGPMAVSAWVKIIAETYTEATSG